jgi:DNA-binding PadR family transcriptional regulator
VNLTRLMVLGTLAAHGPQHGHQIRRLAELTHVTRWGGVSPGALYRELRLLEGEALVTAVRTEKVGRRPARTVYEITDEGLLELHVLREHAMSETGKPADPLGVALLFGGVGDMEATRDAMRARRKNLETALEFLAADRSRGVANGVLDAIASAVTRRGELHIEAEIRWHEEFDAILTELAAGHDPVHRALPDPSAGRRPTGTGPQATTTPQATRTTNGNHHGERAETRLQDPDGDRRGGEGR